MAAAEHALCCTTSVAVGQRAAANHSGIGITLALSTAPPPQQHGADASDAAALQQQPPPMLAVVLDVSMEQGQLQRATQAIGQAARQLSPHTRLLLLTVDQVVSAVDLKTPRPQTSVLHGLGSGQGPAVLPQLVQAADVRATPLAHCRGHLASTLAALRHHPRQQQQGLGHHLRITTAAADIALFLLSASMAAWDAQHRQQQQQQPKEQQQPLHNARVMVLTGLPSSSCPTPAHAAALLQLLDEQSAAQIRAICNALSVKARSLDIPVDVITGSLSAPAALVLQEVSARSHGQCLHQPRLQPPLAANIAAIAQSRYGYEGVLDVQLPPGVKLLQLSGRFAAKQPLPRAARLSGSAALPVTLLGAPPGAAEGSAEAAAAGAAAGHSAGAAGTSSSPPAAAGAGPMQWSAAAVAVPVLSSGSRFVAALELARDWQPGSSFDVGFVCEWTAADGRRLRQVVSHTVQVTDRLAPFIEGLDVPAVVLLLSQRLVATAAAAGAGLGTDGAAASSGAGSGLGVAGVPGKRAVEEGRLAVGMALAHVAQRLGHAHVSRRGLLGFGAQQVWQLPDELIPLALSFYQLQRGPLLNPAAAAAADEEAWGEERPDAHARAASSSDGGGGGGARHAPPPLLAGSWRVLLQQFLQCSPSTALRMVAPWLYVFDAAADQFDVLPPLNLALEPDAIAVLDCGSEVLIYVGSVLAAAVEGALPTPAADAAAAAGDATRQQQHAAEQGTSALPNGNGQRPAPPVPEPDLAEAAAPALRCAHQLIRGRTPVPAIHVVDDAAGMVRLVRRLVPLHEDPLALQLLLLPHLRDLSPAQHGYLLDWHKHWSSAAASAAAAGQRSSSSGGGGARLAAAEQGGEELGFGAWYSSFGVVLSARREE